MSQLIKHQQQLEKQWLGPGSQGELIIFAGQYISLTFSSII